jgi:hypothetical protein
MAQESTKMPHIYTDIVSKVSIRGTKSLDNRNLADKFINMKKDEERHSEMNMQMLSPIRSSGTLNISTQTLPQDGHYI